ncbi:MAG: HipA domain-containing protein [Acidobacteria bacterium]|nr:HipA domain-containing protein [Acidobacteriota bacterium]
MNPDLRRINALAVSLHGRRVGIINRLAGERHLFAFEQDYVDDPDRPTLSLSYKGQAGGLVTSLRVHGPRLPPFFSNLLPEGHLRTYLAEKADVNPEREFFLLAVLGADLAGAVTVKPLDGDERAFGHDYQDDHHRQQNDVLRFSLAGVQLKFSAVAESSGGLTIPAHGVGGSWIVKLPSTQFPCVPENEYVMLELARAAGIQVPEIRLVPVADIRGLPRDAARLKGMALAVDRFDRAAGGRRIHMEDFAQVFGMFPDTKYKGRGYANVASVLWAETGEAGTYEFVRRLVFSVLIGNGDMHLKNWSLLYPDGRTPALSPAYDFVATLPYLPNDSLALTFGRSRSLSGITLDQVRRFTDTAHLPMNPVWEVVRETVERTADAWRTLGSKDLIPAEMLTVIDKQIQTAIAGAETS